MIRVYIAAGLAAFFIFTYWAGVQNGRAKCTADVITTNNKTNNEIINNIGDINEVVLKTGTDDIRGVLRRRYSIAE